MESCKKYCESVLPRLSLPTEAQWEYACRAGADTPYSFGASIDRSKANYRGESSRGGRRAGGSTRPVGSFPSNGFGLHDMHGNVWEWCADVYDQNFYHRPAAAQRNPQCTASAAFRVFRGGAWHNGAAGCRAAVRSGGKPSYRNGGLGFRPVYVPGS